MKSGVIGRRIKKGIHKVHEILLIPRMYTYKHMASKKKNKYSITQMPSSPSSKEFGKHTEKLNKMNIFSVPANCSVHQPNESY